MYREWKKLEFQKRIMYDFGNNKTDRKTKI